MKTTEETELEVRIIRLEARTAYIMVLILITVLTLAACILVIGKIMDKEFSMPTSTIQTK